MKNGWNSKPLSEVCVLKPSKSEISDRLGASSKVSFLPMEDLPIGGLLAKPQKVRSLSEVAGSYTFFAEGDVLLAKITPCFENGKLGIAANLKNGVGFGSSEYFVLRPERSISNEWLYYFLSRERFRAEAAARMTGAVGHKRVPREFIETYPLPIPSLAEQKRIVGILNRAIEDLAKAVAKAEANVENSRALFGDYLQSFFSRPAKGWLQSTIGEHIHFIDYRGKTPKKTEEGLRLITAKNVKMGYVQDEPREYVAPSTYKSWMTRGVPRIGDVLFTTEAPLANIAQLDTNERVVFAQRIIIMQPHPSKLDATFLKYLLLSAPVQQRIHEKGTGATVKGIKASLLRTVAIAFPQSLTEQKKIVEKLDAVNEETQRLEKLYERKVAALEALKQSILHDAFIGNL